MSQLHILPKPEERTNEKDLAYFIALQESRPAVTPDHSAEKWNRRAEFWKKESTNRRKGDERMVSARNYLDQRGLLKEHFDVVDIGCGPGKFAAEFAKKVHHVTGLDISDKMVAHGTEYLQQQGITNATLKTCDFQSLDIKKEGYEGAFDLVFSSMTPAIHGMNGLIKSMDMSRGWCCHITRIDGHNILREQMMQEVFGKKTPPKWTGRWFYSLFNVLFLMGYNPETSYDSTNHSLLIDPDEEYLDFLMEHTLPQTEINRENARKIKDWLDVRRNKDGFIEEITDSTYARILWNVKNKTIRHGYHAEEQEVL